MSSPPVSFRDTSLRIVLAAAVLGWSCVVIAATGTAGSRARSDARSPGSGEPPDATSATRESSGSAHTVGGAPLSPDPRVRDWNRRAVEAWARDDIATAQRLLRLSAGAGDVPARYNLAVIRLREESRTPGIPVALRWLRDCARSGFADAQYLLGTMLDVGQHVKQDKREGSRWLERAARQGHPDATLAIGLQYFLGRGVAQDYGRAAYWYERAAEAGDVAAQYMLASMYETGLGVATDLETALRWYSEAARQGDVAGREKARSIVERLARERST